MHPGQLGLEYGKVILKKYQMIGNTIKYPRIQMYFLEREEEKDI